MIERLNQITLNDFIELSCGNYACLLSGRGSVSESMLKEMASKLIIEYRSIVNPSGMQAMIMDKEDMVKERAKLLSLRICQTLVSLGFYDDVRQVLGQLNVDIRDMSDEQVISKLDHLLHSAIFEQKRNEERRSEEHKGSKATPEQIRSSFDAEIAFLMTFFKMSIDSRVINAAVYANIVHQADVEISIRKRSTHRCSEEGKFMLTVIRRILSYTKPCRKELLGMLLFALIGTGLSLFVPILIGKAVDCVVAVHEVDFPQLWKIIIVLALTIAVSALFQWLMSLCTNRLAAHTIRDLRCDLFSHLQHVPLRYIDGQARGDLIGRAVSDMEIISDGFLQAFTQFVTGIFTILGTLIFMLTINVRITVLVVILTPISLLVAAKITQMSRSSYLKSSDARGALGGLVEEMIGSQKVVKAFTYEKRAEERFDVYNTELQQTGAKATFFGSITNPVTRFVNALIYAAVGVCGALAATGNVPLIGVITVGQLASFLTYANQYTKPFNEISGVVAELQNAVASAKRVFAVIDEPAESDDSHLPELQNCNGTMQLSHVKFSYVPDRPLITDFNLDVHCGQRIAIVGPTGCGKTTLINLLLRFYDVDGGEISVAGQNIAGVTRDSLRACYGMVLQETWLFTGSIAENIAYSRPDATREEIVAAAKAAYADGFIRRLPKGYDTVLTEDGSGLSQGQKQLLCIARIMLTDPPFLILDEATSSIDLRTEQRIQKAFEKLMAGKTSFIIAHRLSTIKSADWILVMNQGNVLEQGTHDSLMAQKGFYANLYQSQFADSETTE